MSGEAESCSAEREGFLQGLKPTASELPAEGLKPYLLRISAVGFGMDGVNIGGDIRD
jgi:hypothetical protein